MKEYEQLAEEFVENKMIKDPVMASFMKLSWELGFLKATYMAKDILFRQIEINRSCGKSRFDDFDLVYKELNQLGEKEV